MLAGPEFPNPQIRFKLLAPSPVVPNATDQAWLSFGIALDARMGASGVSTLPPSMQHHQVLPHHQRTSGPDAIGGSGGHRGGGKERTLSAPTQTAGNTLDHIQLSLLWWYGQIQCKPRW